MNNTVPTERTSQASGKQKNPTTENNNTDAVTERSALARTALRVLVSGQERVKPGMLSGAAGFELGLEGK